MLVNECHAIKAIHVMTADTLTSIRELDCRWTGGTQVRLLWCQFDGQVWVTVMESQSGGSFRIDVPDGERPLDVFHHPYAYPPYERADRDFDGTQVANRARKRDDESEARP